MRERILVTGASGFVGTHLRSAIAARWPDADVASLAADVRDQQGVISEIAAAPPRVVFHLAGQASTATSLSGSAETWAVNAAGTLNVATAIAMHAPEAVTLFASSSEVYGASFLTGAVTEASPLVPLTPYAKSKAAAERLIAEILPPQARLIVARPFNHTGRGQRTAFVLPSFAQQIAEMETGRRRPCLEVGNLDVSRDFLDVRDVVAAYIRLVEAASSLPPRFVCNVATGRALKLREQVERMRALASVEFAITVDPDRLRPADVPVAMGDPSLLRSITAWTPQIPFDETLADLLDYARTEGAAAPVA